MDKEKLLGQMTLEEKASLCSGADFWHLKGIERLGIPSIMVTDGPHGLRKQEGESDHVGLNDSVPATCFPTASCTAASSRLRGPRGRSKLLSFRSGLGPRPSPLRAKPGLRPRSNPSGRLSSRAPAGRENSERPSGRFRRSSPLLSMSNSCFARVAGGVGALPRRCGALRRAPEPSILAVFAVARKGAGRRRQAGFFSCREATPTIPCAPGTRGCRAPRATGSVGSDRRDGRRRDNRFCPSRRDRPRPR